MGGGEVTTWGRLMDVWQGRSCMPVPLAHPSLIMVPRTTSNPHSPLQLRNRCAQVLRKALEETAKKLGGAKGYNIHTGHGLVQAEAAYTWLSKQSCAAKVKKVAKAATKQEVKKAV